MMSNWNNFINMIDKDLRLRLVLYTIYVKEMKFHTGQIDADLQGAEEQTRGGASGQAGPPGAGGNGTRQVMERVVSGDS